MPTRERIHRLHSPSLFTLIALCFLLPFATVTFVASCSPQHGQTSFTGIQLVTHTVPRGNGTGDCSAAINKCVEHKGAIPAEVAFGAALLGLMLGLLGIARGPGWCVAVGLGALLLAGVSFTSPHVGYRLAVVLFVWAGALHLRRWLARRRARSGGEDWNLATCAAAVALAAASLGVFSGTAGIVALAVVVLFVAVAGLITLIATVLRHLRLVGNVRKGRVSQLTQR